MEQLSIAMGLFTRGEEMRMVNWVKEIICSEDKQCQLDLCYQSELVRYRVEEISLLLLERLSSSEQNLKSREVSLPKDGKSQKDVRHQ